MNHLNSSMSFFLIAFTLIISSCKNDNPQVPTSVVPLVEAYKQDASEENGKKLSRALSDELRAEGVPDKGFLESALVYADRLKDDGLMAECLKYQLKYYFNNPESSNRLSELIEINDVKLKKQNSALALKLGYVSSFPSGFHVAEYKKNIPEYLSNVDTFLYRMASNIVDDNNSFDINRARDYVNTSEYAVIAQPNQGSAAQLLFNAAKTAGTLKDYNRSLNLYSWILDKYPNSKLYGKSLFMKAFTYDTNVKDLDNAKKYYDEFLKKYPNDELADDAQFLLDNLGVSEEELLRRIQAGQTKK